jgi:hypothetical protein
VVAVFLVSKVLRAALSALVGALRVPAVARLANLLVQTKPFFDVAPWLSVAKRRVIHNLSILQRVFVVSSH